jgi:GDP-L-fucose synthase
MIRKCADAVRNGMPEIQLWGDGSPTREFLYVKDAADAILRAAMLYQGSAPVNIGSGEEISMRELAARIAALTGFEGRILWDKSQPNGQPRRKLDVRRAEREFGFLALTKLSSGLRATVEYYLSARGTVATTAGQS